MKTTIAALLGLISATKLRSRMDLGELTNEADSVLMQFDIDQNDLDDGDQQDTLGIIRSPWKHDWVQLSDSDSSSESSDSEGEEMLQHHSKMYTRRVEETSKDFGGFPASDHGFIGNNHNDGEWKDAYERVLPGNYDKSDEHQVDTFTANVLENYATEGVTKDGKPNK